MSQDNKIVDELKKAYDAMSLEQIDEYMKDIEVEPLPVDSEQRIKSLVKEKMKKANGDTETNTKQTDVKQANVKQASGKYWKAAAVVAAFAMIGAIGFHTDTIRASVAKLFGFVPGQGIVEVEPEAEEAANWYVLKEKDVTAKDDMVQVEVKDAFITNDKLELRYSVYLSKITDADLEQVFAEISENNDSVTKLYQRLGYDQYFTIHDENQPMTPLSVVTVNGIEMKASDVNVTGSETTEGVRLVCVSACYDVRSVLKEGAVLANLMLGEALVEFQLDTLELGSSPEEVANSGLIEEMDGIKVLCVPTWKDDVLYTDYYAYDLGEYQAVYGFHARIEDRDVLTVDGVDMVGEPDESYIFDLEGSSHFGARTYYELGKDAASVESAVLKVKEVYAKKTYDDRGIALSTAPADVQNMKETIAFEHANMEIVEMSKAQFGMEEGFEELEHGYLILKYRIHYTDDSKAFAGVVTVSINGVEVEYISEEQADLEYNNMIIPLSVPYEDIQRIGFDGVMYRLHGNMEFELK